MRRGFTPRWKFFLTYIYRWIKQYILIFLFITTNTCTILIIQSVYRYEYITNMRSFIVFDARFESLMAQKWCKETVSDTSKNEIKAIKRQEILTTAYSEFDSCHTGKSCLMASGRKAYIGAVACPRWMKLKTKVTIDGVSYICEDRYKLTLSDRIDIFQGYGKEAYDKAIKYGKQTKLVIIK